MLRSFRDCPNYAVKDDDKRYNMYDVSCDFKEGSNVGVLLKCPVYHPTKKRKFLNETSKVVVKSIDPTSKYKSLISIGDILVAINGRDVRYLVDASEVILRLRDQESLVLTFANNIKTLGQSSKFITHTSQMQTKQELIENLNNFPVEMNSSNDNLESSEINKNMNKIAHTEHDKDEQRKEDHKELTTEFNGPTEGEKENVTVVFAGENVGVDDSNTNDTKLEAIKARNVKVIRNFNDTHNQYFDVVYDLLIPPGRLGLKISRRTANDRVTVIGKSNDCFLMEVGVDVGDQILSIDDIPVKSEDEVIAHLEKHFNFPIRKLTIGKNLGNNNKVYTFEVIHSDKRYEKMEIFLPPGQLGVHLISESEVKVKEVLPDSNLKFVLKKDDIILNVDGIFWRNIDVLEYLRQKESKRRKMIIQRSKNDL